MFTVIIIFSLPIIVVILTIDSRLFFQVLRGFPFNISGSIIFSEISKRQNSSAVNCIFFYKISARVK